MDITLSPTLAAKEAELEEVEAQLAHLSHGSRTPATWITRALDELHSQPKGHLDVGNMLIILDVNDFSKACRVHSFHFVTHTRMKKACDRYVMRPPFHGIDYLLVLENKDDVPTLVPRPLSYDVTSEEAKERSFTEVVQRASQPWVAYYKSYLRIVSSKEGDLGISENPEQALPHIEGIVKIVKAHGGSPTSLTKPMISVFWVFRTTLWPAIAMDPIRWCNLAIDLQDKGIYEEAFTHLVGAFDSIYCKTAELPPQHDILPLGVQGTIAAAARELKDKRMNIDLLLQCTSLQRITNGHAAFVSHYDDEPAAYDTVNLFRDYMIEHIRHLRWDAPLHPTPLCGHTDGCDTVAGFYRIIAAGGDRYLKYEDVISEWCMGLDEKTDDRKVIKDSLKRLKVSAAKYVQALVDSPLQTSTKGGLHYLTCVKVEQEDIPWLRA